jgi:HEAT repeat protein
MFFTPIRDVPAASRWRVQKQDQDIQAVAAGLWSPDDAIRTKAKADLISMGAKATKYLINLLVDLAEHRAGPHFATGKEVEGLEYWRNPSGPHRDAARFEITWRLIFDCMGVLAELKCGEAAPIIVEIMEERDHFDLAETMGPEHYALVKIGAPAVPTLIQAIENAEADAIAIYNDPKGWPGVGLAPDLAVRIRIRAVNVLGEIGDKRALPVLEDLVKPGGSLEHYPGYVQPAINKIRSKGSTPR